MGINYTPHAARHWPWPLWGWGQLAATTLIVHIQEPNGRRAALGPPLSKMNDPKSQGLAPKHVLSVQSSNHTPFPGTDQRCLPHFPLINAVGIHHGKVGQAQGLGSKRSGSKY